MSISESNKDFPKVNRGKLLRMIEKAVQKYKQTKQGVISVNV